jgi:hypothetical protein
MVFERHGNQLEVRTRTEVAVLLLGIVLYRLHSDTDEIWIADQLQLFHATTDDDGDVHKVDARRLGKGYEVIENGVRDYVLHAVLPGTLWNPATLNATELIDPFEGRRNRVRVTDRGMEQVDVQGRAIQTHHVSITQQRPMDVWYSRDGRILRMSYRARDGSMITSQLR